MGFIIGTVVFVGIAYFFFSRSDDEGHYEDNRVVESAHAGHLELEEQAAFRATFAEIISLWVEINDGLNDVKKAVKQDVLPEAQRFYEMIREPIEALPEIASQGEEFRGSSQEPVWWSQHMTDLASRLAEVDEDGRISDAVNIEQVAGSVRVSQTLLEDMIMSCDDFARRMLNIDVLEFIKDNHGPASRKHARAALSAAQVREQY